MGALTKSQRGRLHEAWVKSWQDLESRRKARLRRIELKAGVDPRDERESWDGERRQRTNNAHNLYELAHGIYKRGQVSANPKCGISSRDSELNATALGLELVTNLKVDEMDLEEPMNLVVNDALNMFGVGHLSIAGDDPIYGYHGQNLRDGEPIFEHIDTEDWVHDTRCNRIRDVQFEGHSCVAPVDWIKNNESFSRKVRNKVEATESADDEMDGENRQDDYEADDRYRFREVARIWQMYIPDTNRKMVFYRSPRNVLLDEEWEGEPGGPYHKLIYEPTPRRDTGSPPGAVWEDLSVAARDIMAKLLRQARRQKTIPFYPGGQEDDARMIRDAKDGEWTRYDGDPDKIFERSNGGPNAESIAMLMQIDSMSSRMWGNLDALGGLSPQAETLGQDRMLIASASQRMQKMQERTMKFAFKLMKAIAWYYFHDPELDEELVHEIDTEAGPIRIPFPFNADHVQGNFFDMKFRIDPYSMQPRTPIQRAQLLTTLYTGIVIPSIQLMMAQGLGVDMDGFFRELARGYDLPELSRMIKFTGRPQMLDGIEPAGGKPSETTRTYNRRNIPQTNNQQRNEMVSQILLKAGRRQPAEMASFSRPSGGM